MPRSLPLLLLGALIVALPAAAQPHDSDDPTARAALSERDGAYVMLRSGEVIRGTVEMISRRGLTEYVVVNGESYPYYHVNTFRIGDDVMGFADLNEPRPVLVMQLTSGRASLYRELDREGSGTEFFQIGDGPIRLASHQNLRAAFADHPGAMRHLNTDRTLSYAAIGAVIAGAALVGTGAVLEFSDIEGPSGIRVALMGVGLAVAVTGAVAPARSHFRRAAISAYNQ